MNEVQIVWNSNLALWENSMSKSYKIFILTIYYTTTDTLVGEYVKTNIYWCFIEMRLIFCCCVWLLVHGDIYCVKCRIVRLMVMRCDIRIRSARSGSTFSFWWALMTFILKQKIKEGIGMKGDMGGKMAWNLIITYIHTYVRMYTLLVTKKRPPVVQCISCSCI